MDVRTDGRTGPNYRKALLLKIRNVVMYIFGYRNNSPIITQKRYCLGHYEFAQASCFFFFIVGLTWAVKNCDNMTELIKMDDDIFVHLPAFLERARRNKPINQNLWMLGRLQVGFIEEYIYCIHFTLYEME